MVAFHTIASYAWMVPLFPLAGFLLNSLAKKYLPGDRAGWIASLSVALAFVFSALLFLASRKTVDPALTITLGNWMHVESFRIAFSFLIDPLSITMMLIITGVGLLIIIYSMGYMKGDDRYPAFFAQMNLFTFAMLLLVMGANYLILFIGWEGVGLCSYLLIGFWYKNPAYNAAARKAFIMNRIGDFGFLFGMILLFITFQSLNFDDIFPRLAEYPSGTVLITAVTLLLLLGAVGKSAQIPLFTWLPDAMAGPTPVSALIHAATMVTAGIYLIARSSQLFVLAPLTMGIIVVTGLLTALLAASISLYQNDIKKVLAYSTVSQLGYMFLALGLGAFSSAIFHLTTHAFFKALLFLGAGSVIHALHGEQNIRRMGGLRKAMPWTFWTFLVATLAISGIPPFSGFFSKDEILVRAWDMNPVLFLLGLTGALLTCFYMFRLLFLVFGGSYRGSTSPSSLHESPRVMTWPLALLAVLSLAGGLINLPHLLGGHEALFNFLKPAAGLTFMAAPLLSNTTEWSLMLLTLLFSGLTILLAWYIFIRKERFPVPDGKPIPFLQKLISNKYYLDEAYHFLFVKPFEYLSDFFYEKIEKGIIDYLVNLFGYLTFEAGVQVRKLQSGNISFYAFVMLAGIIFFLILQLIIT